MLLHIIYQILEKCFYNLLKNIYPIIFNIHHIYLFISTDYHVYFLFIKYIFIGYYVNY